MWAGLLLKLHGESGKARHLYLTQDLSHLIWKEPKKDIANDSKMEIHRMVHVDRGLITDELKKKSVLGTGLDPLKCFALTGTDCAEGKRKLSFEVNSVCRVFGLLLCCCAVVLLCCCLHFLLSRWWLWSGFKC